MVSSSSSSTGKLQSLAIFLLFLTQLGLLIIIAMLLVTLKSIAWKTGYGSLALQIYGDGNVNTVIRDMPNGPGYSSSAPLWVWSTI